MVYGRGEHSKVVRKKLKAAVLGGAWWINPSPRTAKGANSSINF
jgi:hypothetical protein